MPSDRMLPGDWGGGGTIASQQNGSASSSPHPAIDIWVTLGRARAGPCEDRLG